MNVVKNSLLAVIAARSGSKGLQDKNIKKLLGRPLMGWPIKAALSAKSVDKVVVSTDSPLYAAIARRCGADVPFLRPSDLAGDNSSSVDVVLHALNFLENKGQRFKYVVLLEPTSPLTESSDIDAAFDRLLSNKCKAKSIVGISELVTHHPNFAVKVLPNQMLKPAFCEDFSHLPRRQEVEEMYFLDGSFYLSEVETLKLTRTFYTDRALGYEMPDWKALEVDTILDFVCVEAILKNRKKLGII